MGATHRIVIEKPVRGFWTLLRKQGYKPKRDGVSIFFDVPMSELGTARAFVLANQDKFQRAFMPPEGGVGVPEVKCTKLFYEWQKRLAAAEGCHLGLSALPSELEAEYAAKLAEK